jgi:chaperonin cofactor prefoldin
MTEEQEQMLRQMAANANEMEAEWKNKYAKAQRELEDTQHELRKLRKDNELYRATIAKLVGHRE